MRPALLCLILLGPSLLAGCLGSGSPTDPPLAGDDILEASAPAPALLDDTACNGYNVIHLTETAPLRPHVPANWTFTSPQQNQALGGLRVLLIGCAETRFAFVSTPMHPDDASAHHHDNPDVIIAAYADRPDVVTAWRAAGLPAEDATLDWTEGATGDDVRVTTENGTALRFVSADPRGPWRGSYAWPATYATGRETIAWIWGHENATTRTASTQELTLGPASPLAGTRTVPWHVAAWLGIDVRYDIGTPAD